MTGFMGRLQARLGLDTAEFSRGLRGAQQEADGFGPRFAASMRRLTGAALGVTAIGTAAAGAAVAVRAFLRDVAAIGDQAAMAGVDAETWQEWAHVFETNRIPAELMTEAFKELNLRADEFAVTGGGSAADAMRRLGFDAEDVARRLEDPSELLLEITRRMQRLDTAARIRVSDELFGGAAGERFVQLVDQGAEGLAESAAQARELGRVMENDAIARATILSDKFTELTDRARGFVQTMAVGLLAGGVETSVDALERIFGSLDRARAVMGDDWFDAVTSETAELAEEMETAADALARLTDRFDADAVRMARDMADVTGQLADLGRVEEAIAFDQVVAEVEQLVSRLRAGEIGAADFETEMRDALDRTLETMRALDELDGVELSDAITRVMGLRDALSLVRDEAQALRDEMPGGDGQSYRQAESFWDTEEERFSLSRFAPTTSPRPQRAPNDIDFDLPPVSSSGGSGGSQAGFEASAADIRARTEALLAEAAALAEVAASGQDYGDAAEYAAVRAEMLAEAQEDGRELTPELRAEIDAMAQAYVAAGQQVEALTEALERQHEAGQRGASALTDVFMAAMDGADAGRAAVARLIMELARMQAMRAFEGLSSGGGLFGSLLQGLGALLGKNARGTPSWRGGLSLVGEEGPELLNLPTGAQVTPALETARLAREAARGANGGRMHVSIGFDETMGGFRASVMSETGAMMAQGFQQMNAALPGRVRDINRNPRRR